MIARPLAGRHVVTTRLGPGRLDTLLAALGADAVNIPLIAIEDPADGGAALRSSLGRLDDAEWLVVTSRHGAEAVGHAAALHPALRLAAVGSNTAAFLARLAGRPVDIVPKRQTASELVAAMPPGTGSVVVAQADRADASVGDGLRRLGYRIEVVTAYRTILREPNAAERRAAQRADAVAFASGSAVESWVAAFGSATSPAVIAIGPTTADVARRAGLQVAGVAADHDVEGLVDAIMAVLA
ncbi:MAG: uroporphyrinogen-III synthase [Ilumatobacteraceae bacterium]